MNKNAIKKFATEARRELISRVSQRALKYGISDKKVGNPNNNSVGGHLLSSTEKKQRAALIEQIKEKGYEQVMEEVAYTWFNRFSALRFMEVNGYLPTRVRVFTDENNAFKPQILTEAIHMELNGLDMEKVYAYKEANDNDELYKYLLITQCNALNSVLPGMFQKIADYTELLLPDNLLREGSVIEQMITTIPEDDWKDAVQIIGWLYQYYNSEKKDDVFAALKKNVKITKENIPAATQLFTPDWIVRYMVENSLSRLWVEGHPNDELKSQWKYYLEEAEQEPDVKAQLASIREEYKALKPEDILCIDPCSGSGHILAYIFDVLVQIYEAYGVDTRTAVASIVENNIYGLDIDDRAAQLAYFSVMMKACQYDKRFLRRKVQPHVYAVVESNYVDPNVMEYFCNGDAKLKVVMDTIISELYDAKEYGSILTVTQQDWSALYDRFAEITEDINMSRETTLRELLPLVQVAEALAQKYDVVVTNPPYMGASGMSAKLSDYVKKNYPDSKSDLFAVFIEKCGKMPKKNGYQAMITQHAWMFLESFEKLRNKMLHRDVVNMVHLGAHAFEEIGGEIVQTVAFVCSNRISTLTTGKYIRLTTFDDAVRKEKEFSNSENSFECNTKNYLLIPTSPFSYWISNTYYKSFREFKVIGDVGNTKKGVLTGNDKRFVRLWFEISQEKMGRDIKNYDDMLQKNFKWIPATGGGTYRKWYGNFENVINMENDSYEIRFDNSNNYRLRESTYYFQECSTWSEVSGKGLSMRYVPNGILFGNSGPVCFWRSHIFYWLALLNTKVSMEFLRFLSPTLTFGPEQLKRIPCEFKSNTRIEEMSLENVEIARNEWDSFETSWDFQHHPLLQKVPTIAEAFNQWQAVCNERFQQLKANEEELNRIFIDIYGLQDELTPEVEDKDVTVRKADLGRDIRSFISYAVGCMFGRYSLDMEGLAYAGGEWDNSKYSSFAADKDNIIPICDDEYFEDDIVGLFVKFVKTVYGADTLDENLRFIADALGGKGQPKDVIRNYFLSDFYSDHCKIYQKRPIYWLFDSGKKNGFKCLIYMHRYQLDTIARIRTDYVHEQQARYRTAIDDLETRITNASTSERVKLNKQFKTLNDQATEIHAYEEKIHHLADQMISIDLDDGVKKNYDIFKDVLAKIK